MTTSPTVANGTKKWCVMLYLAADIDLEQAAMADLDQMKAAGSSSQVDLLAQLNPGSSRLIRRYHLQNDTYLEEDRIMQIGEDGSEVFIQNANAKRDLLQFIEWCASRSKAEHYALVLWGHGQGWKAANADPCFVPGAGNPRKSIEEQAKTAMAKISRSGIEAATLPVTLNNGETGFLTNADLREVLAQATKTLGKKIDILGLDACLMAMAEICCQVDKSVDYLVACEDTVPDESWPYDSIMKLLVTHAQQMTPEDLARTIVWKFVFDFGRKKKYVTQSICQLGGDDGRSLENFTAAVSRLVDALLNNMNDQDVRWAMMIARAQVQSFFIREYVDLYDFCRLLSINSNNKWVSTACDAVMEAIAGSRAANGDGPGRKLVIDCGTYGYPLKRSFGVSIYFPCVGAVPPCYPDLEFCKKTNWHKFLEAFLKSPGGIAAREERPVIEVGKPAPNGKPAPQPAPEPAFAGVGQPAVVNEVVVVAGVNEIAAMESGNNGGIKTTHGDVIKTTLGDVIKTTHGDVIKTTHGDVIKTTHGDPIKTPDLPVFLRPHRPQLTTPRPEPQKDATPVPQQQCNCGHRS